MSRVPRRLVPVLEWWFDGAVRGLVLGLIYPFPVAAVATVRTLADGGEVDLLATAFSVALFGVLIGAFVGPLVGLAVGLVCSALQLIAPPTAARSWVGAAGVVITGGAATAWLVTGGSTGWQWWFVVGGPVAMGLASLVVRPLEGRVRSPFHVTTS